MQNLAFRSAIALVFAGVGCSTTPQVDMEAEVASLRAAADEYHQMASAKNAEGVIALYAADNVMLPPCSDRIEGIEGTRSFAEEFTSVPNLAMSFSSTQVEVSASGDMGYTVANANVTMDGPDGTTLEELLRDVHIWQKVDGVWKVVLDVWNSPNPLPCPEM